MKLPRNLDDTINLNKSVSSWVRLGEFLAAIIVCTSAFFLTDWFIYSLEDQWRRTSDYQRLFYSQGVVTILFGVYLTWRLREWIFSNSQSHSWDHHQFFFLYALAWFLPIGIFLLGYFMFLASLPVFAVLNYYDATYISWLTEDWIEKITVTANALLRPVWTICAAVLVAFGDKIKAWSKPPEPKY